MNIGSGLSFQTRTVNGKVVTGVFLSKNSGRNARTKPKYPIRSRVDPDENPNTRPDQTGQETIQNILSRNQDKKQQQKNQKQRTASAKTLPPNASRKTNKVVTNEKDGQNGSQASEKTRNVTSPKGSTGPHEKSSITNTKDKGNKTVSKRSATKPKEKTDDSEVSQPQDVSTKFVTLTQGQLNTILSLVKSKNEIDITEVLEGEDNEGSKGNENPNEEDKKEETQDGNKEGKVDSRPASQSIRKVESIGNLLKRDDKKSKNKANNDDNISSKGGKNLSRESTKIKETDLDAGRKSQENLPAAIRSSFFIGEAAPRAHAFSARKREEQQRWREELDKQRTELRQKKEREKDARLKADESDSWAKHFDTMLPSKNSPRTTENFTPNPNILAKTTQSTVASSDEQAASFSNAVSEISTKGDSAARSTMAPIPSTGITKTAWSSGDFSENKDFVSTMTTNALPQRSSYLRTMTSLLDPAQIEANEVKRRKQDEHRRAIEAQVEERKCKKEEEQQRQQRLEAEEDRRLAADRDSFAQKTELEKLQQQMQVNMREQNTKELHQQMKNAEESALRDKLSKRERILKNRGHDTSRLEMTHQMALEMSHKVAAQPLAQASQISLASNSSALQLPQEVYSSNTWTPSQVVGVIGQGSPVAMTAQTEQGPIKLEISLNQKRASELVESGMQTDDKVNEPRNLNFDSDAETEYLQLPQKRRNTRPKEKEKKDQNRRLQNYENNLNRQYDRHSRADRNIAGGQPRKKNGPRPKWGVRETNKTFVPASQRYTSEQQKHDAVMRKREERHVVSDPDRSRVTSHSPTKHPSEPRPKSPVEPVIRNRRKNEAQRPPPPNAKTSVRDRPSSGIYATTDHAKYRSEKHSRDSPVPETKDFVQYHRTTAVFDPNQPQSRPETGPVELRNDFVQRQDRPIHGASNGRDPLLNPDVVRQHERQEQILKEISILRQGLLIKQREVASYPAAMTHSMAVLPQANLVLAGGGNLPERTNDTPVL